MRKHNNAKRTLVEREVFGRQRCRASRKNCLDLEFERLGPPVSRFDPVLRTHSIPGVGPGTGRRASTVVEVSIRIILRDFKF